MEFYHYFSSVTFVVLSGDQFVGRDDGPLEQQKQDSHACRRNRTFPLILRNTGCFRNYLKKIVRHSGLPESCLSDDVTRTLLLLLTGDARNVSFGISLRWPIHINNSLDKTKFSSTPRITDYVFYEFVLFSY